MLHRQCRILTFVREKYRENTPKPRNGVGRDTGGDGCGDPNLAVDRLNERLRSHGPFLSFPRGVVSQDRRELFLWINSWISGCLEGGVQPEDLLCKPQQLVWLSGGLR